MDAEKLISYSSGEFYDRYFAKEGYKEGLHGYVLCKMMEFYRIIEIAKYWERTGYKELIENERLYSILEKMEVDKAFEEEPKTKISVLSRMRKKLIKLLRLCIKTYAVL